MNDDMNTLDTSSSILYTIELLIKDNFKDAIIWDEKSSTLKGKYFYTNIKGVHVGIFLGFTIKDGRPDRCIAFCFSDPKGKVDKSIAESLERIFINLSSRLKGKGFIFIKDDLPAVVKKSTSIDTMDENGILEFFKESLHVILYELNNLDIV
jgi:hypothetical protein